MYVCTHIYIEYIFNTYIILEMGSVSTNGE